jgi:hypothetical protein
MARNLGNEVRKQLRDKIANFEKAGNDDRRNGLTPVEVSRLHLAQNFNEVPHPPLRHPGHLADLTTFNDLVSRTLPEARETTLEIHTIGPTLTLAELSDYFAQSVTVLSDFRYENFMSGGGVRQPTQRRNSLTELVLRRRSLNSYQRSVRRAPCVGNGLSQARTTFAAQNLPTRSTARWSAISCSSTSA